MDERLELSKFTLGPFAENGYLLVGPSGRAAALVDPGLESEVILDTIVERDLDLQWIVNTHAHLDHVSGNRFFKDKTGARLILHAADLPLLDNLESQARAFGFEVPASPAPDEHFEEGVPFLFDGLEFEVLHTPGHSPGGVCLLLGDCVIVGDTLFQGSIGRTDLPGGSMEELVESIRGKLFGLSDGTVCYPGHGPETTVGVERKTNPFVADRLFDAAPQGSS